MYAAAAFSESASPKKPLANTASPDASHLEHPDPHLEHDAHEKDSENSDEAPEDKEDDKNAQETNHTSAQAAPIEEPESKELQQEKAMYEMNAYFDDYLLPRPFIIGSTEF